MCRQLKASYTGTLCYESVRGYNRAAICFADAVRDGVKFSSTGSCGTRSLVAAPAVAMRLH